jgi:hypothetical protein
MEVSLTGTKAVLDWKLMYILLTILPVLREDSLPFYIKLVQPSSC